MAERFCYINKEQKQYLKRIWPGAVTVVLTSRSKLPKVLTADQKSLAIRLPKNKFLIKLIDKIGQPIVSTSLNVSGKKPLARPTNLKKYFKILPDLVIDAGKIRRTKPSKLIDITDVKKIKILRK